MLILTKIIYIMKPMTRRTRRFLFYTLLLIFILGAPLTIFYTAGYSFDWQKMKLIKTGGIYLKSTPAGAEIFLDNKPKNATPRLLSRLLPRDYHIAVSKNGFYSWQKTLSVYPQIVTEARNIFLFPKNSKPELVNPLATSTIESYFIKERDAVKIIQAQKIASTTLGWRLKNDNIFYISENNLNLYRADLSGSVREQISRESLPENNFYTLDTNDQRRFWLLSQANNLYFLDKNDKIFKKLAGGVLGAQFSSDNKKILYFNQNEIFVYFLDEILIQPYKKANEKKLITRHFEKISQAIFYPNNEHIAYVAGDKIKIIELDDRGSRNSVDFISAPQPQIYFDEPNSFFYYLTKNEIFRVKLEL